MSQDGLAVHAVYGESKRCTACEEVKPRAEFDLRYPDRQGDQRYQSQCRPCRKEVRRFYRYGITSEEYHALLAAQGGVCAICRGECPTGQLLSVDHDHATGAIRGLLCRPCNIGLGSFKDNPSLVRRAAEYMDRP